MTCPSSRRRSGRETGDARWLGLAERFWSSMVGRKMYISGGWARGVENPFGLYLSDGRRRWSMTLNGESIEPSVESGYAVLEREWKQGDTVVLSLDMGERVVSARPEVRDVAGLSAHMRGPVLLARENGRLIPYYDVANRGPAPHEVWA